MMLESTLVNGSCFKCAIEIQFVLYYNGSICWRAAHEAIGAFINMLCALRDVHNSCVYMEPTVIKDAQY